jgi:hypothetical protein
LAQFCAALPLLRQEPAAPWAQGEGRLLFEVDVAAFLKALGLPSDGLSGDTQEAIARRASALDCLAASLGFAVDLGPASRGRDYAVAAKGAFDAIVACCAAAWLARTRPRPPGSEAEAWLPLPGP